jgi:hypothetical protein
LGGNQPIQLGELSFGKRVPPVSVLVQILIRMTIRASDILHTYRQLNRVVAEDIVDGLEEGQADHRDEARLGCMSSK